MLSWSAQVFSASLMDHGDEAHNAPCRLPQWIRPVVSQRDIRHAGAEPEQ
jgi:hypothetical protein